MTSKQQLAADGSNQPAGSAEGEAAANDSIGAQSPDAIIQPVHSFHAISGGLNEVIIEHEGHKYRLRATRNGRLLLNK